MSGRQIEALGSLAGIAASLLSLILAPLLMPESYSWIDNTTSESAAQGIEGAWLARLGFVLFGLAALWVVRIAGGRWRLISRLSFVLFGALMVSAAAFAVRPWDSGAPYDRTEDLLHSIAASGLGTAFAIGVFFAAFRHGFDKPPRLLDAAALAATIILPLGMSFFSDFDGLLQRAMFLIAYAWLTREVLAAAGWQPAAACVDESEDLPDRKGKR